MACFVRPVLKGDPMNRKLLPFFLLLVLSGCATRGDLAALQQDVEELKGRTLQHDKSIALVRTEAKDIAEKGSREALKSLDTLRKGTADMQANLDTMRVDLQAMTGKVDDLGQAAKKPFDDISLLKEDTSKAVVNMDERIKKLESELAQSNARIAAISKSLETPESLYKQGLDALNSGESEKSREMLAKFKEQFPDHKLAANAAYWIGETYYREKNYEQAVLEFQKVIKDYPGKEKVPAAMLKQGMAFKELGDLKSARFVLKELIEKFPRAEEIGAAKEALSKLK